MGEQQAAVEPGAGGNLLAVVEHAFGDAVQGPVGEHFFHLRPGEHQRGIPQFAKLPRCAPHPVEMLARNPHLSRHRPHIAPLRQRAKKRRLRFAREIGGEMRRISSGGLRRRGGAGRGCGRGQRGVRGIVRHGGRGSVAKGEGVAEGSGGWGE